MQSSPAIAIVRACPSCGAANVSRFCAECGQAVEAAPAQTGAVLREGAAELLGLDRSVLRTLRDLLIKPIRVIEASRVGGGAGYVRPFRLFFLLAGAYIVLLTTIQPHTFSLEQQMASFRPADRAAFLETAAERGVSMEVMGERFEQRVNASLPLVGALLLVPMAMLLRRMDRSRPLGEHVLFMASITNSMWIACILMLPLAFLGSVVFMAAAQVVSAGFLLVGIARLYPGRTRARTALRAGGFLAVDLAMTMLASMIMMFFVLLSVIFI